MTTMTIQVPDALEKEHDETVRLIAAKLYEWGKLSLGQAAVMCDMKELDFADILIKYDVRIHDKKMAADLDETPKKRPSAHNFLGIISAEDARLMENAIEEGCEKIHPDDWK